MTTPDRSLPDQSDPSEPAGSTTTTFPPFGNLPMPSWNTLTVNPLDLAVIEAQLTDISNPIAAQDSLKILEVATRQGLPEVHIEPTERRDINVSVGEDGVPDVLKTITPGWQYMSPDVPFTAVVLPTSTMLQTNQYQSFGASLGRPFFTLLQGVAEALRPTAISRLGLRYVNRLVDENAATPDFWIGRINESFLGPVLSPQLGSLTVGAQQQFELHLEGAVGATVRYGLIGNGQQPPLWSYLIDIDVYDGALTPLDTRVAFDQARRLNATALALFQLLVTPTYRESLGVGDTPARSGVTT